MILDKTMHGKLLIFLFLWAVSVNGWALSDTGNISITKLASWNSGTIFVNTNEQKTTNPAGCSITDKYILSSSTPEMTKSMLLSAYIADEPINLVIYGDGCDQDRPLIVAVNFNK
ncbi:hypothetical protein [Microbulbifer sp. SSSA005]|uniref:hypothetical protein n=1 Tax=Microbulbifer sp. SSSA005 TaxID=3243378 RepID=UPI00403A6906